MSSRADGSRAGDVDVIVIGAGHSGLAMSHCLTARGIEHVVLERGQVANSWRRERWDSFRLLTPNWLTRLPGCPYTGKDPDGYMSNDAVVEFIAGYAHAMKVPVHTETTVTSVMAQADGYSVTTNRGAWRCRAVIVASGGFNAAVVPAVGAAMPRDIAQLTPFQYRNPAQLEPGGVLVVGSSATGVQLADEIQRAGHAVTLSVGEHVRLPRFYRGRDIQWWMLSVGILDARFDAVDDLGRARGVASPQLVGSRDRPIMDLNALTSEGARLVGRVAGLRDGKLQFSGSLRNVCALADLKMERLLGTIDEWADPEGYGGPIEPRERFASTVVPEKPRLSLDLASGEIRTVLWATGYRPDYSWLQMPVLDRKRAIQHDGGVAAAPGLYVMGLPFLRRRKSSFIHGAEDDARELCEHLVAYLDRTSAQRPAQKSSRAARGDDGGVPFLKAVGPSGR